MQQFVEGTDSSIHAVGCDLCRRDVAASASEQHDIPIGRWSSPIPLAISIGLGSVVCSCPPIRCSLEGRRVMIETIAGGQRTSAAQFFEYYLDEIVI